ncbi:MAG: hypothetical protein IPG96_09010 [Proteobacteria bacterium]|nr:hypothetical protein [Pseudomonadota bacterium]
MRTAQPGPVLLGLFGLLAACGHGDAGRKPVAVARPLPAVLIEGQRLPNAIIISDGSFPSAQRLAQERDRLCAGDATPVVFLQVVLGTEWHYYFVCNQQEAVRAMTRRGEQQLSAWLDGIEQRAGRERQRCAAGARGELFSQAHSSGTSVVVDCDGTVVLRFADGGRKTLQVGGGGAAPAAPAVPADAPIPPVPPAPAAPLPASAPSAGTSRSGARCAPCPKPVCEPDLAGCPPPPPCPACPACARAASGRVAETEGASATLRAARTAALLQGRRQACDALCPALFKRCRQQYPRGQFCFELSEFCATLPGVCLQP